MTDMLTEMLQAQLDLQKDSFKADPTAMDDEGRIAFIHWNHTALCDELHEMLGEVGWKPWASSKHVNSELAFAELVDAWHFFMNLLWATVEDSLGRDVPAEVLAAMLHERYFAKREINARRQEEGYDGVAGKCPVCARDRKTTAITAETPSTRIVYCPCEYVYESTVARS